MLSLFPRKNKRTFVKELTIFFMIVYVPRDIFGNNEQTSSKKRSRLKRFEQGGLYRYVRSAMREKGILSQRLSSILREKLTFNPFPNDKF